MEPRGFDAVLGGWSPPPIYGAVAGGWEGIRRQYPQPNPTWLRYGKGLSQLIGLSLEERAVGWPMSRKSASLILAKVPLPLVAYHYNEGGLETRQLILKWLGSWRGWPKISLPIQPEWVELVVGWNPKWLTVWRSSDGKAVGYLIPQYWDYEAIHTLPRLTGPRSPLSYRLGGPAIEPDILAKLVGRYLTEGIPLDNLLSPLTPPL